MLGAFFILTDPVTASTTVKGRIVYGLLCALLVVVIRNLGGYPDAVAFAVLLANMCVPLIDYYTKPKVYGRNRYDGLPAISRNAMLLASFAYCLHRHSCHYETCDQTCDFETRANCTTRIISMNY